LGVSARVLHPAAMIPAKSAIAKMPEHLQMHVRIVRVLPWDKTRP
jgi:hypothetical protein